MGCKLSFKNDPVDVMLRGPEKPTGSTVVNANWRDNPWFTAELEQERLSRDAAFGPDIRLSCQVVVESDMTVRVLGRAAESGMTPGPRPLD